LTATYQMEAWRVAREKAQITLGAFETSVLASLPDMVALLVNKLPEEGVLQLALLLDAALYSPGAPFPMGRDVVILAAMQQLSERVQELEDTNVCSRAAWMVRALEEEPRLQSKEGSAAARDVLPGIHGLRQMVVPFMFGAAGPMPHDDVQEARPLLRNLNENECNKLLAALGARSRRNTFAVAFGTHPAMSKGVFNLRFREAFDADRTQAYRAVSATGVMGSRYFDGGPCVRGYPFDVCLPAAFAADLEAKFDQA